MDKLKIAHHFKLVLRADDFILTGTFALQKLGFDVKVKDLDIILVNPKQSTLETLEALEKANPPKNLLDYPTQLENKKIFRFIHDGVGVDVFIYSGIVLTETQTQCGLKLASFNHIVKAKKDMGRPKDMIQLFEIICVFIIQIRMEFFFSMMDIEVQI
jgi:hypothetical protein